MGSFWHKLKQVGAKDQIISEAIFLGFKSPKKQTKFLKICALASKMGQIKKNVCFLVDLKPWKIASEIIWPLDFGTSMSTSYHLRFSPYSVKYFPISSTEDMSFEFKKAFEKATERRALTFNQQWAMSDIGKNKSIIGLILNDKITAGFSCLWILIWTIT